MAKLLNPFQYRNPLGGLNSVRPLDFTGKVNHSIDIVALDSGKADSNQKAAGKLLRCDDNGSMLYKNANGFRNKFFHMLILDYDNPHVSITFSKRVYGVLYQHLIEWGIDRTEWTNSDYTVDLLTLPVAAGTWIPFTGTEIYFRAFQSNGSGTVISEVYGFY